MDFCCKEGFLQKAGKRSFQAWRKRWFVLNGDSLKYYNPASEYNETNLLGVLQMVEVQSIVPSKNQKHGFDIITRSRTYSVSAKSDLERDDWILALRKASSSKRRLDNQPSLDASRVYDEITTLPSPKKIQPQSSEYEYVFAQKNRPKEDKKGKSKDEVPPPEENNSEMYDVVKPRSQSCLTDVVEKMEVKPRAATQDDDNPLAQNIRAHSILRKMSKNDDDGEKVAGLYQELDDQLEKCSSGEEEEEDDDTNTVFPDIYALPKPRGEAYAFDEIRKVYDSSELETLQQSLDLDAISKEHKLNLDKKEEYPAMQLLKLYVEKLNSTQG